MKHSNLTYSEKLKIWSLQFEKNEWNTLCCSKPFLNCVMDNPNEAAKIAGEILKREIESF